MIMKKTCSLFVGFLFVLSFSSITANGQAGDKIKFSTGLDIYSNYIWRGSKLGTGPSLQPSVTLTAGGLTIGVWGAFDANGYSEADPYLSYSFPFGLSLGVTDYYYPSLKLSDFSDSTGSHAIELNAGFTTGGLSL